MRKYLILIVFIILSLVVANPVSAAPPKEGYKPVHATDIQIVKKVTLKGASAKGGKTSSYASTGTLGAPLPNGGTKYAVVIGINDYPGTSSDLHYCVADANLITDVLHTDYGFPTTNIKTILDSNATKSAIYYAINALPVTSKDEFVFFFSGHGAKGKADDGDSNPIDQSIVVWNDSKTDFDFIWDGELVQWFSDFPTNRIIFAFDSCLAGGMAVLNNPPGRVVCMGSAINSMSLEGSQWGGGHGQFTYYFAEQGMENGLAGKYDYNGNNILYQPKDVSVEEAFDYAKANCKNQTPTIADGFKDDLLP